MLKLTIDKETQDILFFNFLNESHPKTRLKNFVLYLKSNDYKHGTICDLCRITKPTLTGYLREYNEFGLEVFKKTKWKGRTSVLNEYKDLIDENFEANPPKTINEAQARVEKLTGIKRSPTQIRYFLNNLNYRYLKMGSVPGNGDGEDEKREEVREDFKKKSWNHCWKKQSKESE